MLLGLFTAVVALICIYTIRHYCFTVNRIIGQQRHPYVDVDTAEWPPVTVLIAAHNEEAVVGDILTALLEVDYPAEKLAIVPVNDRSVDRTREIIDSFVVHYPGRITPFPQTDEPYSAQACKGGYFIFGTVACFKKQKNLFCVCVCFFLFIFM